MLCSSPEILEYDFSTVECILGNSQDAQGIDSISKALKPDIKGEGAKKGAAPVAEKLKQDDDSDEGPPRNRVVTNVPIFNLVEYIASRCFHDNPHHAYSKLNRSTTEPEKNLCEEGEGLSFSDFMQQFAKFPFESNLAIPILTPTNRTPEIVCKGSDPTFDLIDKKRAAVSRLNGYKPFVSVKNNYKKGAAKTLEVIRKKRGCPKEDVKIPKEMIYLTEAVEMDPDPTFCAEYNWYVTGGALSLASVSGRNVLFYPSSSDLSTLTATPLKKKKASPNGFSVQEDQSKEFESEGGQIYQIKSLEFDKEAIVVTRQQKSCQLIKCTRQDELAMEKIHECFALGNDTFTSVELNPWNSSEYMTCTRSRTVNIYDVNTGRVKEVMVPNKKGIEERAKKKGDMDIWGQSLRMWQWNKTHFSLNSQDEIFFTDESSVVLLDRRNKADETIILDIRKNLNLYDELMPCEAITFSCSSVVDSQLLYVATTHNLFSVDCRKPNRPVQCWKHCLSLPPVFVGQSCFAANRELLLLCSSWQKEIVGITNEWNSLGEEPISRSQPYLLSSTNHTLLEANKQGCCLQPNLKNRLQSSRIGICCTDSSKPTIFSVNVCGDVFFQKLHRSLDEPKQDTEHFKSTMNSWSEAVTRLDLQAPLNKFKSHMTVNPSDVITKVLIEEGEESDQANLPQETGEPSVKPELPFMLKQEDLFEGIDNPLNSKILEQWGIYSQQDWESKKVEALGGSIESTAKITRVSEWLATSSSQIPDSQGGETQYSGGLASQVLSQDLVSASQEEVLIECSQAPLEIGQEAATDQDVLKSRLFTKYSIVGKRRKRHDGF